jgi:sporulation protein YlmC with PRC-barrel domain
MTIQIALLLSLALHAEPANKPLPDDAGIRADEVYLGPIASARSMLNAAVRGEGGEPVGQIADIVLDVGRGRLASIEVHDGERQPTDIDASRLEWSVNDKTWTATVKPKSEEAAAGETLSDDSEPLRIRLTDAAAIPVYDRDEAEIGKIVDFGIATETEQIAYAAMEVKAGETGHRYPVPIAAFVVPDGETWVLEVEADVLSGTPTILRGEWPENITRNWVEYIHVRYGRPPLGGVQRELHESESPN